jgi:hypothetical protein
VEKPAVQNGNKVPKHGTIASIVKEACLLICCIATNILLLRVFASAGMRLPSRCLALDIHVSITFEATDFRY